jgi:NAD(P)-dependent dehydrogenase (short-subunit alcohol dehydrogenase family)
MTVEDVPPDHAASVLVTGCSAGLGYVIAKTLAQHGHRVFATMRDPDGRNLEVSRELTESAAAESLDLAVIELDVASETSVNTAVASILATGAPIDVVVNNAGISASGPVEAFSDEQVAELYNVNCFGQIRVDRAVLPHMRARGSGLLIHMSSTLGRVLPGMGGIYPATKWAVEGIAESIAYEVRSFGIDVVILEPGAFPTTAVVRGMLPADEAVAREYAERVPLLEETMVTEPPPDYVLPDLREVGDEIARLIALPAGQRPLRSIVGPIFTEGVPEYNRQYELTQETLRRALDRPDQAITWI